MGRYLSQRLVQGLVVILGVTTLVFVVTRMIGDPVNFILPLSASEEQRAALRADLGFDRSILSQFWSFLSDAVRLDFGESTYFRNEDALGIVRRFLPKTLQLVVAGMIVAFVLSVPLGAIAALRPGKLLDKFLVTLSLIGLATPQFFLGQVILLFTSVKFNLVQFGDGPWTHLIFPALTLALPAIGRLTMVVRSAMIDELNSQYVKAARAKGVSRRRIVGVHALRNAAIPFVTLFGWEVIRALAGYTLVVEAVFDWPGLGDLAILSIRERDFFLIQTIVFVVAVMVVLVNIVIDIAYKIIDPRVKIA
ncbi:MAG: ABC transporter permease [Acidimicrobiia bacterium]|nr:ABC transporter permease [Acidimicrobiia bacterium]MBA3983748.1 ABC transporter permease [Acidimicrobiia bacterium]MDQ3390976.1 ABC transporter permease [Actinomycetota bacterium]